MNATYKFADDTTVVGWTSNNDESNYRREIESLVTWCNENNLSLQVGKTKELIIDGRKKGKEHAPIYINGTGVERVECVKFLGVTITNSLSWTSHIDVMVKKTQRHLFFLRQLRKFSKSIRSLTNFNRCTTKSILSGCIMAWYGNCSAQYYKKLDGVHSPDHHRSQPSIHELYLHGLQPQKSSQHHQRPITP
eukprot:g26953.t1